MRSHINAFSVRTITKLDKTVTNEWLDQWGLHKLDEEMYPDTGLVMFEKETNEPLYVGYIWIPETSNMAMIGFITRNPNFKKAPKESRLAFIEKLREACKELGKSVIITWTDNPFLVKDFKELQFAETSNKCSELIQKYI